VRSVKKNLFLKVVVHVGCECLVDAMEMARHAQEIGCDGVACMGPSFFRPNAVEDLVAFLKKVADMAPETPFYYYHFPTMNNINFPLAKILEVAKKHIPNLRGAKFTDADMENLDLAFLIPDLEIFMGKSTLALPAIFQGASGAFVSDFLVKPFSDMISAWEKGNISSAQKLGKKIAGCNRQILLHGGMPAAKFVSHCLIVPNGGVRLPLRNISSENKEKILEVVKNHRELFSQNLLSKL